MSVRPNKQMLQRAIIVMTAVILCLTIVSSASLVRIMIVNGEEYQAKASQQQFYDSLITAPRGNIYDSSIKALEILSKESDAYNVSVVLMTDGMSNYGSMQVLKSVYSNLEKEIPIYSIMFGSANSSQLNQIAELTNAKVFDGSTNLLQAFKEVRSFS